MAPCRRIGVPGSETVAIGGEADHGRWAVMPRTPLVRMDGPGRQEPPGINRPRIVIPNRIASRLARVAAGRALHPRENAHRPTGSGRSPRHESASPGPPPWPHPAEDRAPEGDVIRPGRCRGRCHGRADLPDRPWRPRPRGLRRPAPGTAAWSVAMSGPLLTPGAASPSPTRSPIRASTATGPMAIAAKMPCRAKIRMQSPTGAVSAAPKSPPAHDTGITTTAPRPAISVNAAKGRSMKAGSACDPGRDVHVCPAGEDPICRRAREDSGVRVRRYRTDTCRTCPVQGRRATDTERRITRCGHGHPIGAMRERQGRDTDPMTLRRRTVEHPFDTIKAWTGHTHFLIRRRQNFRTEWP